MRAKGPHFLPFCDYANFFKDLACSIFARKTRVMIPIGSKMNGLSLRVPYRMYMIKATNAHVSA